MPKNTLSGKKKVERTTSPAAFSESKTPKMLRMTHFHPWQLKRGNHYLTIFKLAFMGKIGIWCKHHY